MATNENHEMNTGSSKPTEPENSSSRKSSSILFRKLSARDKNAIIENESSEDESLEDESTKNQHATVVDVDLTKETELGNFISKKLTDNKENIEAENSEDENLVYESSQDEDATNLDLSQETDPETFFKSIPPDVLEKMTPEERDNLRFEILEENAFMLAKRRKYHDFNLLDGWVVPI